MCASYARMRSRWPRSPVRRGPHPREACSRKTLASKGPRRPAWVPKRHADLRRRARVVPSRPSYSPTTARPTARTGSHARRDESTTVARSRRIEAYTHAWFSRDSGDARSSDTRSSAAVASGPQKRKRRSDFPKPLLRAPQKRKRRSGFPKRRAPSRGLSISGPKGVPECGERSRASCRGYPSST